MGIRLRQAEQSLAVQSESVRQRDQQFPAAEAAWQEQLKTYQRQLELCEQESKQYDAEVVAVNADGTLHLRYDDEDAEDMNAPASLTDFGRTAVRLALKSLYQVLAEERS